MGRACARRAGAGDRRDPVARETVRLAFAGALQHLPPRQRSALLDTQGVAAEHLFFESRGLLGHLDLLRHVEEQTSRVEAVESVAGAGE